MYFNQLAYRSQQHGLDVHASPKSIIGWQQLPESGAHLSNAGEHIQASGCRIWTSNCLAMQQTIAVRYVNGDSLVGRYVLHVNTSRTAQIDKRNVEVNTANAGWSVAKTISFGVCVSCDGIVGKIVWKILR